MKYHGLPLQIEPRRAPDGIVLRIYYDREMRREQVIPACHAMSDAGVAALDAEAERAGQEGREAAARGVEVWLIGYDGNTGSVMAAYTPGRYE